MFREPEAFKEVLFILEFELAGEGLTGLKLLSWSNARLEEGNVFLIKAKHANKNT